MFDGVNVGSSALIPRRDNEGLLPETGRLTFRGVRPDLRRQTTGRIIAAGSACRNYDSRDPDEREAAPMRISGMVSIGSGRVVGTEQANCDAK